VNTELKVICRKSILAGLTALTLAGLAGSAFVLIALHEEKKKFPSPPYSIEWHLQRWPTLGVALLVFVLGFIWQFKRMSGSAPR